MSLWGPEELLEGLVEPFDLAAGLGAVGTCVCGRDAEREELLLDGAFDAKAGARGEDQAIVGDQSEQEEDPF